MRSLVLAAFSLVIVGSCANAQDSLDSALNTLHNKDARSAMALVAPSRYYDSVTKVMYGHSIDRVLTSKDMYWVKEAYPEYVVVEKLVRLLDDPERDWYANLLLYNLTGKSSVELYGIDTREQWLRPMHDTACTYKDVDLAKWRNFMEPHEKYSLGIMVSSKQFDSLVDFLLLKFRKDDGSATIEDYLAFIRVVNSLSFLGFPERPGYHELKMLFARKYIMRIVKIIDGQPCKGMGYYSEKYHIQIRGEMTKNNFYSINW